MLVLLIENAPLESVSFNVNGPVRFTPVTLNVLVVLLPTVASVKVKEVELTVM